MTAHRTRTDPKNWELPSPTVAGLLQLGITSAHRPVDRLLDRVTSPAGASWFAWAVASTQSADAALERDLALIHQSPVDEAGCVRIKEAGKAMLATGGATDHGGLRGSLIYLIGVAGALAWHGKMISTQPPRVLEPILMDLAETAPEPWRPFFERAGAACATFPGNAPP